MNFGVFSATKIQYFLQRYLFFSILFSCWSWKVVAVWRTRWQIWDFRWVLTSCPLEFVDFRRFLQAFLLATSVPSEIWRFTHFLMFFEQFNSYLNIRWWIHCGCGLSSFFLAIFDAKALGELILRQCRRWRLSWHPPRSVSFFCVSVVVLDVFSTIFLEKRSRFVRRNWRANIYGIFKKSTIQIKAS